MVIVTIITTIIPTILITPIILIIRFISSVELGKVMADLGERLSEEEVCQQMSRVMTRTKISMIHSCQVI